MARLDVKQNPRIHMLELADIFYSAFEEFNAIYSTKRYVDLINDDFDSIAMSGVFAFDGSGQIVSGTISRLELYPSNGAWVEITKLSLDVADVMTAIETDGGRAAGPALTELIYGLDWIILGQDNQDFIYESAPVSFDGNDTVKLGEDMDDFFSAGGDDVVYAEGGDDRVIAGDGNDYVSGGNGRDTIEGNNGDDLLEGDGGRDRISGLNGKDTLDGGGGQDNLRGGRGDDVIIGGTGHDRLSGGTEADIFIFNQSPKEGNDKIIDFDVTEDVLHFVGGVSEDVSFALNGDDEVVVTHGGGTVLLMGVDDVDAVDVVVFPAPEQVF